MTTEQDNKAYTFCVDVNRNFTDKVKPSDNRFRKLCMTFNTERLTIDQLVATIRAGFTVTAPHHKKQWPKLNNDGTPEITAWGEPAMTTYRVKRNVIGVSFVALDCDTGDHNSTLEYWCNDPFAQKYASFVYTTASHTLTAPRCRVVFVFDNMLTVENGELFIRALMAKYPHVDQICKDACRLFYGSKNCEYKVIGNIMPAAAAVEFGREWLASLPPEPEPEPVKRTPPQGGGGQIYQYVDVAINKIIGNLESLTSGRHGAMLSAILSLYGLKKASWLTGEAVGLLDNIERLVMGAMSKNGYIAKYGKADILRALKEGWHKAQPATGPNGAWCKMFKAGDTVTAVIPNSGRKITGTIAHMKQDPSGQWIAKIGDTWVNRDWLQH